MATKIKIQFMSDAGLVSDTPGGSPVIAINMQPAAPENFHSPAAGSTPVIVYALIDTGADRFYMDEGLANAFSYHRAATINVMGGTGTLASQERPSIFSIDGHSEHYAASFVSTPLSANGRIYQAVLGLEFLKQGALVMDFNEGVFEFTLGS